MRFKYKLIKKNYEIRITKEVINKGCDWDVMLKCDWGGGRLVNENKCISSLLTHGLALQN